MIAEASKLSTEAEYEIAEAADSLIRKVLNGDARDVSVRFCDGNLMLQGRLNSFYHKQLAQEAVRYVDGVHQIVNKIEVA